MLSSSKSSVRRFNSQSVWLRLCLGCNSLEGVHTPDFFRPLHESDTAGRVHIAAGISRAGGSTCGPSVKQTRDQSSSKQGETRDTPESLKQPFRRSEVSVQPFCPCGFSRPSTKLRAMQRFDRSCPHPHSPLGQQGRTTTASGLPKSGNTNQFS